ncbi:MULTISPECIES: hypothetical protein [Microvirga]|uniref:hypothetical protein n=1 Tax=Microvirga TaxID=186650 RepID=UPI0021C62959|nr:MULTISPECIES: hypothetical protein [unclassified Microvirga]
MATDRDDYDVFLDTWEPSKRLKYATLPSNLFDSIANQRLVEDSTGQADVEREAWAPGTKGMTDQEVRLRGSGFFEAHQPEWSADFRDRLISEGLDPTKVDHFLRCFAEVWVDGLKDRQNSDAMMAIKASIRDHDIRYHPETAGKFVINQVPSDIQPLFRPEEMKAIFRVNSNLLEVHIALYHDHIHGEGEGSINREYVRRGVLMGHPGQVRRELQYLSSYSLAVTPVEQFSQTRASKTAASDVPTIFSAPLPAVQTRVVAFAPHISGMSLGQLELVVAPPVQAQPLKDLEIHRGIHEFWFE